MHTLHSPTWADRASADEQGRFVNLLRRVGMFRRCSGILEPSALSDHLLRDIGLIDGRRCSSRRT